MVDGRKAFTLVLLPATTIVKDLHSSRSSDTPQAGFEPAQNPRSGFIE